MTRYVIHERWHRPKTRDRHAILALLAVPGQQRRIRSGNVLSLRSWEVFIYLRGVYSFDRVLSQVLRCFQNLCAGEMDSSRHTLGCFPAPSCGHMSSSSSSSSSAANHHEIMVHCVVHSIISNQVAAYLGLCQGQWHWHGICLPAARLRCPFWLWKKREWNWKKANSTWQQPQMHYGQIFHIISYLSTRKTSKAIPIQKRLGNSSSPTTIRPGSHWGPGFDRSAQDPCVRGRSQPLEKDALCEVVGCPFFGQEIPWRSKSSQFYLGRSQEPIRPKNKHWPFGMTPSGLCSSGRYKSKEGRVSPWSVQNGVISSCHNNK